MTRVLVVDDEIDTLNLLRTILEISGYQAVTTLNSTDAITLAEVEHPDLVLLDIMMPQLDGFTLCKMMRLHPATMNLPIVFVTAYSALDLEDRRMEAGADMVLPKPVGMDTLIETVEKVQTMRGSGKSNTPTQPRTTPSSSGLSTYTALASKAAAATQTAPSVPTPPAPTAPAATPPPAASTLPAAPAKPAAPVSPSAPLPAPTVAPVVPPAPNAATVSQPAVPPKPAAPAVPVSTTPPQPTPPSSAPKPAAISDDDDDISIAIKPD
jgi:CheY-like chemotaxis protein